MITTLEIGSIVVPSESLGEFEQTYTELAQTFFRRTADGTGVLRSIGNTKLRTVINGVGWIPSALENIDRSTTHVIRCAMTRTASSGSTTVTLPAARRSDAGHQPIGFALVGDQLVSSVITNLADINSAVTNDATLTAIAGASGYRVHYFPEITAAIVSAECQGTGGASFNWSFEAEEV